MTDHLVRFIKSNHIPLLKIYIRENKKSGPGALFVIEGEKSNVNVTYYPINKITDTALRKKIKAKMDEISNVGTLKVENKLIYSMPNISLDVLPETPTIFLVIVKDKKELILLGIPQPIEVDGKKQIQYLLIGEPKDAHNIEAHWTVSGTTTGYDFIKICQKALEDEEIYGKIRSMNQFNEIIINGAEWEGKEHLKRLEKDFPEMVEYIDKFRENDLFGTPLTYDYKKHGKFSANTLRYVNTLMDLKEHFKIKDDWSIVELGSGYGGLAKIICSYIKPKYYTLIDLEPVLKLSQKYLKNLDNISYINYINCEEMGEDDKEYNLLISEYSLTELNEEGMETYYNTLFKRCNNAYIVANIWDYRKKKQFIKRLEELFCVVEEYGTYPKTEWPNYILVCYERV